MFCNVLFILICSNYFYIQIYLYNQLWWSFFITVALILLLWKYCQYPMIIVWTATMALLPVFLALKYFFSLHMWTVPLNGSSMCWR